MKTINQLSKEIHENAKSKGFFDEPKNIGEMLCLIHSEVSEALEADRKGQYANVPSHDSYMEFWKLKTTDKNALTETAYRNNIKGSFEEELADIMIRVMDLAAFKGIDLEKHIELKMAYNATREHKHGKKY